MKWNATLAGWTGVPANTAVGSNLAERYPHLNSPRFQHRLRSVFELGQTAMFAPSTARPFIPIFLDDDRVMLQKTMIVPITDHGRYAQICLTDVTAQYHQIQALRREKEQH